MDKLKNGLVICLAFVVCAGLPAAVHGQADATNDNRTVAGSQQLYAQRGRILSEKRDADIADLDARYAKSLQAAAEQAQKAGQLELLLAIRHELERFEKRGSVPDRPKGKGDANVEKWHESYNRQHAAIVAEYTTAMATLTTRYLEHLDLMKQELTKAGNVKEALAFMQESERLKRSESAPAPVAVSPEPLPENPVEKKAMTPLELLKAMGIDRRVVAYDGGSGTFSVPPSYEIQVTHEDRNRVADGAIQLRGGRTLVEGVDDLLLAACQASQAITITAEITPRRPRQEGPARIISFSLDANRRNVSLCQEGRDLVLRLRTSDTGLNGTTPQVTLATLERDATHKLAVTYRPGDLRFFLDGTRLPVETITGNLANWEPCHLVLGNEWEGDQDRRGAWGRRPQGPQPINERESGRAWHGTLHQFAIYARFMPDMEGVLKTRR